MKVKWLGHACFLMTSGAGLKVLTDPYKTSDNLSYGNINESADVVLVTHEHFDHSNTAAVGGKPTVLRGAGIKTARGLEFKGTAAYHDQSGGQQRGADTIFCFTMDGIRLCHVGDLGHELNKDQLKEIGAVDVLMIPVGGFYTIDAATATKVAQAINPRVILPMHYKNDKCALPIANVEEFLKGKTGVKRVDTSEVEFHPGKLPGATETVVLKSAL